MKTIMWCAPRFILFIVTLHLILRIAACQDGETENYKPAPPPLPKDKDLWLNSTPFTWEQLRGKGVCLLVFNCTSDAAESFPAHLQFAKLHAVDPIVYIGVAMQSDRNSTEQYLKTVKCSWPTLCDPKNVFVRECDAACGLNADDAVVASELGCFSSRPRERSQKAFGIPLKRILPT